MAKGKGGGAAPNISGTNEAKDEIQLEDLSHSGSSQGLEQA